MIYLLGLLARAGHGKTTVARHLARAFGAQTRSLAGPMKRAVQTVFGFSQAQLWGSDGEKEAIDQRYGFSPRWLLQRLGTEGLRGEFGEDIHLRALLHGIRKEEDERPRGALPRLYVIDDVRFPNDAHFIARGGEGLVGAVMKLVATDAPVPPFADHPSELAIDAARAEDVAATVVSSRAQGVAHLVGEVEQLLLTGPTFAPLRPALCSERGERIDRT